MCLKICYFRYKIVKIAKHWGLYPQTPLPVAAGGSALRLPHQSSILYCKFFSLHLLTHTHSFGIDQKDLYVLVIIAGMHQVFGVKKNMLHFLC